MTLSFLIITLPRAREIADIVPAPKPILTELPTKVIGNATPNAANAKRPKLGLSHQLNFLNIWYRQYQLK